MWSKWTFECENCHLIAENDDSIFQFDENDDRVCPKCSSTDISLSDEDMRMDVLAKEGRLQEHI